MYTGKVTRLQEIRAKRAALMGGHIGIDEYISAVTAINRQILALRIAMRQCEGL